MRETELVDLLQGRITRRGYRVIREAKTSAGNVDLAVLTPNRDLIALIEAKVSNPRNGLGQLLTYAASLGAAAPHLVLAVPQGFDTPTLRLACNNVGVALWTLAPDAPDVSLPDDPWGIELFYLEQLVERAAAKKRAELPRIFNTRRREWNESIGAEAVAA